MLKDVTLGQYFPGDTVVHRLDPRTKLILVIVYIVALFCAKSYVSYAVVAAFLILCMCLSRIRLRVIVKGLKPLLLIIVLTGLLNMFYTPGRELVHFWIFTITWEGLRNAVFMISRGGDSFGGSTITQQLIKNLTGDDQVTVRRKLQEIFRALQFEKKYTKEEIIECAEEET